MKPYSTENWVLPQSARRLRDEPVETATQIVEQFGGRRATTLGEAQTAAYLDGRLRRAGMKVSADGFQAPVWNGWDGTVLAIWTLATVMLYPWQPVLALLFAIVAASVALYSWLRGGLPLLVEKQPSQNVIGTRALAERPSQRVVVLAPLDAPTRMPSLVRALFDGERAALGRLIALTLVCVASIVGLLVTQADARVFSWAFQFLPALYLVGAAAADWWLRYAPPTPGAVNHAGALAVLIACAEELTTAQGIELWIVGVGASESGAGVADMLRRYPFEQSRTRFITVENVGVESLAYVTRSGLVRQIASDPTLLAYAAAADANDPLINAAPQPLRHSPTLLEQLRRGGWHAIGIGSLDAEGRPPLRGSAEDAPDRLDADLLDRTVRLVLGIARQIDKKG